MKWLQYALVQQGYSLNIDGIFGGKTLEAVRQFQKKSSLSVDGIAGIRTRQAL